MSFTGDATARPPRITFFNLRTGETVELPFTPENFTEQIAVNYARQTIVGMSHQVKQYSHTGNWGIRGLEFFFRGTTPEEVDAIHDGRRFLLSLCYASETAGSVRDGGPPRILFMWPQLITLTCTLDQVAITHEKFNVEGRTTVFRARLNLEEIRDVRLTSEDVRTRGTLRGAQTSIEEIDPSLIGGDF